MSISDNGEDFQSILDAVISEEYIKKITGNVDLSKILHLELKIDSQLQSILDLKDFVPNLKYLVLDYSNISSIRDLGTGIRSLESVSLNSCGICDLDGIGVLTGIKELSVKDNFISDVTPLAIHENIMVSN